MAVLTVKTDPPGAVLLCDPWNRNDYNHYFGVTPYNGDYGSSTLTYKYMLKKPGYKNVYFSWNMANSQTFDFKLESDGTTPPPISEKCTPPENKIPRYPGFHTFYVIENRLPSYAWMVAYGTAPWLCESCSIQDINDPECIKYECCPYYVYQPPPGYTVTKVARHGIVFGNLPWCGGQRCGWTLSYVELSGPPFPLDPPCEYGSGGGGGTAPDPCGCVHCLSETTERTCSPARIGTHSPILGGISVGRNDWAGTLGCIVKDNKDGSMSILSNEHVIGWPFHTANVGDYIYQPAPKEYNSSGGVNVAYLKRWGGLSTDHENKVDAAIASIKPGVYYSNHLMGGGVSIGNIPNIMRVNGIATAQNGMACRKFGRTTGVTEGYVISTSFTGSVNYSGTTGTVTVPFSDQILASICSCPGDSGSIVTDTSGNIIGILFAGGTDQNGNPIAILNKIQNVINTLDIIVLPSPTNPCTEGSTNCSGTDLYECHFGEWILKERNSTSCQTNVKKINVYSVQPRVVSYASSTAGVELEIYIKCESDSAVVNGFTIYISIYKDGSTTPTNTTATFSDQLIPGESIVKKVSTNVPYGSYNFCAEVY